MHISTEPVSWQHLANWMKLVQRVRVTQDCIFLWPRRGRVGYVRGVYNQVMKEHSESELGLAGTEHKGSA